MNQTVAPVNGATSNVHRRNQFLCIVVISFLSVGALLHRKGSQADNTMVSEWLTRNSLGYIQDVVIQAGKFIKLSIFIFWYCNY